MSPAGLVDASGSLIAVVERAISFLAGGRSGERRDRFVTGGLATPLGPSRLGGHLFGARDTYNKRKPRNISAFLLFVF